MEEFESYDGQYRDGDRVYIDRPLPEIIKAENDAVASIVLGSLAILFSFYVFGFILGIFAILNEKKAKQVLTSRHHKYHVATAGMICGWISVGISIFFAIFYTIYIISLIHTVGQYGI